jgi:hypothetical protein
MFTKEDLSHETGAEPSEDPVNPATFRSPAALVGRGIGVGHPLTQTTLSVGNAVGATSNVPPTRVGYGMGVAPGGGVLTVRVPLTG